MDDLPSTFLILSASFSSTNRCFSSGITLNIVSFCLRLHLCVVVFVHRKENWQCFSHLLSRHFPPCFDLMLWCIQSGVQYCSNVSSAADPGEGPQLRPEGPKKKDPAPPYLRDWVTGPPPYLKVWIHHWSWLLYSDTFTFDFSQGQYVAKNEPMADPCLVEWKSWDI